MGKVGPTAWRYRKEHKASIHREVPFHGRPTLHVMAMATHASVTIFAKSCVAVLRFVFLVV